ncbi:BMP family ABC transporter substrate-binding protein [Pseudodesulfovibrio nedwellii]|uniref:BMP family ABC transporter substrate-binding protein n=1 Tax=Pseudodesulfovibrio nedwellii TaxID=2973072 RepID=A0ABM8AYI1_9BACT|nr:MULTISPECIES: BMP family ABC transporter substrate-binding protein [Pseudodesulfovibrio]BDQ36408.1 BMP family ABC transporter substrate-binding protein [Pseudodesulfovibrio nedwellii]
MKKLLKLFGVSAMCMALLLSLVACGEAPQEKKAEEPAKTEEAAAPAQEEPKTVKAGFVYVSPVGDAGYSYAHDQGRQAVDALDWVTTSFVESVPEGADSERVIRNMARKGFDIIFTTSFGYMDPTIKVGKEFPDAKFMHCSGFKKSANVTNYFGRVYQARFLTGMVAGAMTKTDKLGYVAAFPIPEVIRGINAFAVGARQMNPDVEVRVVWTKTWYDPALEKDAAKSLLDAGCDVIAQHQDSPAPQEAAEEAGMYSIGYNSDMSSFAPKAHLTSAIWNWGPVYTKTVEQVRDGSWKGDESIWWSMEDGVVDIAPMGPMVPEDVKSAVMAKRAELVKGNDICFVGPIKDQSGTIKIADGEKATDAQLHDMMWFVEGVVGTVK